MPRETRLERRLDKAVARATTPRGAAIVIATVSTVITVGAGLLMTLVDGDNFPSIGSGLWWGVQTSRPSVRRQRSNELRTAGRRVVMLLGIAFLTVITASITSTFVARRTASSKDSAPSTPTVEQVHQLGARLGESIGPSRPPPPPPQSALGAETPTAESSIKLDGQHGSKPR